MDKPATIKFWALTMPKLHLLQPNPVRFQKYEWLDCLLLRYDFFFEFSSSLFLCHKKTHAVSHHSLEYHRFPHPLLWHHHLAENLLLLLDCHPLHFLPYPY